MFRTGLVLACLLAAVALWAAPAPVGRAFPDIPPGHWAERAMCELAAAGIIEGCEWERVPQGISGVPDGHWAEVGIEKLYYDAPEVLDALMDGQPTP